MANLPVRGVLRYHCTVDNTQRDVHVDIIREATHEEHGAVVEFRVRPVAFHGPCECGELHLQYMVAPDFRYTPAKLQVLEPGDEAWPDGERLWTPRRAIIQWFD